MKRLFSFLPILAVLSLSAVSCDGLSGAGARAPKVEPRPAVSPLMRADKVRGFGGNVFYILRPRAGKLPSVTSSDFGMDPAAADNTAAFLAAVGYCREHPGTRLVIEEGTYRFRQTSPIPIQGLENVFIDGTKAEFITGVTGTFFRIDACNCLEINGLTVDWDRSSDPIDDVVRIQDADPEHGSLDLVFFEKEDVDPAMRFAAFTQCDPESLTFGAKGSSKECYLIMFDNQDGIKKCEKTAPNVLHIEHSGILASFADGETYLLRHYIYDGNVFRLCGRSENVTFESVKFYGSPGMGIVADDACSHFQILNCTVGVDPALRDRHHVSLGADAFHIMNTRGCYRLAGNDVSRQGDDALNVHDGLAYVHAVEGNVLQVFSGMQLTAGDTVRFKDAGYFDTPYEAVITGFDRSVRPVRIMLDRDVSACVEPGFTAWNTAVNSGNYVVENNYFHENRARGLLLQSSEGLCRRNRFYKIQGMAIRVVMDIYPRYWQEGTGVDGLLIRDNVMDRCDYGAWGCQIEISTNIDGKNAEAPVFRNIEITGNTFKGFRSPLLRASNVDSLRLTGNRIACEDDGSLFVWGAHCTHVTSPETE